MKRDRLFRVLVTIFILIIGLQAPAFAHVKWFSAFSFAHPPLSLQEILSPLFLVLLCACIGVIGALVFVDDRLTRLDWYATFSQHLKKYASKSDLIIRVATGAVLLLSWQSGAMLVPELLVYNPWLEFIQLALAIAILSNRYVKYAGFGLIALYVFAFFRYGSIHMLDYVYLLGAGYYLTVSNSPSKKMRASALPALYASVGFSLSWVALEKIVYPSWGIQILESNPFLTLGFEPSLFLLLAAFIEFGLGFLLIVCILQRPIALAITFLFMSTTLVFGKIEFIGHAIVHAALIVFLLQGPGTTFRTPITFFKRINQRVIFSVLSFSIIFISMLLIYSNAASSQYQIALESTKQDPHMQVIELADADKPPAIELEVIEDLESGWNVHIETQNFVFSPEECGKEHIDGQGHAHLYIDGKKVARLYGSWYHIPELPIGRHEIKVSLTSNNHSLYAMNGVPVSATQSLVVM